MKMIQENSVTVHMPKKTSKIDMTFIMQFYKITTDKGIGQNNEEKDFY